MALIAWQATVQDDEGNIVVNPSITVRRASDDELADIFDSEGAALDNPYTGTSEGFVQFFAQPGKYTVQGARGGSVTQTWTVDLSSPTGKQYPSRSDFVDDVAAGYAPADGTVVSAGGLQYVRSAGTVALPGLPGWVPFGDWSLGHFGLTGSGDETAKLQAAFNATSNRKLHGIPGQTVDYSSVTVPAQGIEFVSRGMTFRRISNNTASGFIVDGGFRADELRLTAPGGSVNRNLFIRGSFVDIEKVSIEHDVETDQTAAAVGVTVQHPTLEKLIFVNIGQLHTKNISSAIIAKNVDHIHIGGGEIEKYRTAIYFVDTRHFSIRNVKTHGIGAAVNGVAGENSILLEATAPFAMQHGLIADFVSEDSGEHGYRLGGQQTIADVTFENCTARRSGSSILGGNLSGGEWHGGCGFKILGGASVGGTRHKRIKLINPKVFDVSQTFGTHPAGHGVNNFSAYFVNSADDVTLINPQTDAENMTYSCRQGILFGCVKDLQIIGASIRKCSLIPLVPYDESLFEGFPGYDTPIENLLVSGGYYEVTNPDTGIVFNMRENTTRAQKDWRIDGPTFAGGLGAVRIEGPGDGGSYDGLFLRYTYVNTIAESGVFASPIQSGDGCFGALSDITGPWLPSPAFGAIAANGSVFRATNDDNLVRERMLDNWRIKPIAESGGHQPTATAVTNLSSVSASFTQFMRVGSVVTVSGIIRLTPTATGQVTARLTAPVASSLTASRQAGGTFLSADGRILGSIDADTATNTIKFNGNASVTSARNCSYTYTYIVA